jgi:hypothetical protein
MSGSYPIIINQSNATSNNTYTYSFGSSVEMGDIEIALGDLSMYYSWQSINTYYNNNKFSIVFPAGAGSTTYNLTIPNGTYSVDDLNNYLKYWFISQNLYITNNTTGDITVYAQFRENAPAYSVDLVVYPLPTATPAGFTNAGITFPTVSRGPQFIINNSGFGDIIGFDTATYPATQQSVITTLTSTKIPQVSPVQSVIVTLDAAYNPYAPNSAVIHTFSSKGVQYGSLITSSPNELCWVPMQQGSRQDITLRFLDQSYRPLAIIDNNLTIKLMLRVRQQ